MPSIFHALNRRRRQSEARQRELQDGLHWISRSAPARCSQATTLLETQAATPSCQAANSIPQRHSIATSTFTLPDATIAGPRYEVIARRTRSTRSPIPRLVTAPASSRSTVLSARNPRPLGGEPPRNAPQLHAKSSTPLSVTKLSASHSQQHHEPSQWPAALNDDVKSSTLGDVNAAATTRTQAPSTQRPRRRAKTPVLEIGQLEKRQSQWFSDELVQEDVVSAATTGTSDSSTAEDLAEQYRALLAASRASTPSSVYSVSSVAVGSTIPANPAQHRPLRKIRRLDSLRQISEAPEPADEDSASIATSRNATPASDTETLVGEDAARPRPRAAENDSSRDDDSEIFVDAVSRFATPIPASAPTVSAKLSQRAKSRTMPSITRINPPDNLTSRDRYHSIDACLTPPESPTDSNVKLQICVDLMVAELGGALRGSSLESTDGSGRQLAQIWLLIEAYEGLRKRILREGLPKALPVGGKAKESDQRYLDAQSPPVLAALDNWLDALHTTYHNLHRTDVIR